MFSQGDQTQFSRQQKGLKCSVRKTRLSLVSSRQPLKFLRRRECELFCVCSLVCMCQEKDSHKLPHPPSTLASFWQGSVNRSPGSTSNLLGDVFPALPLLVRAVSLQKSLFLAFIIGNFSSQVGLGIIDLYAAYQSLSVLILEPKPIFLSIFYKLRKLRLRKVVMCPVSPTFKQSS